jgi:SAM-dependent methyltransferase
MKPVLDACCGGRLMWFDHNDPRAVFADIRENVIYPKDRGTLATRGRAPIMVQPDIAADFTRLPFESESFWHVVFDPPHHTHKRMGSTGTGILTVTYGILFPGWEEMLAAGFSECFRVLKENGTLVFKWCSAEIPLARVLALTPEKPLYGHRNGRKAATHWVAFIKNRERA